MMLKVSLVIIISSCSFVHLLSNQDIKNEHDKAEKLYMVLFKRQRAAQLEAIKNFKKISSYEQQYEMIKIMSSKIFSVIQENRAIIEASGYIPGISEFPLDFEIKEALTSILENVALFSEFVLRFPDISSTMLKVNNTWDVLLQWGIAFSNQLKYLLDNSTIILLRLTSQELNHVPRDPNYVNPYRKANEHSFNMTKSPKVVKKKKSIKKGPRLSENFEL